MTRVTPHSHITYRVQFIIVTAEGIGSVYLLEIQVERIRFRFFDYHNPESLRYLSDSPRIF